MSTGGVDILEKRGREFRSAIEGSVREYKFKFGARRVRVGHPHRASCFSREINARFRLLPRLLPLPFCLAGINGSAHTRTLLTFRLLCFGRATISNARSWLHGDFSSAALMRIKRRPAYHLLPPLDPTVVVTVSQSGLVYSL